ncbi:MAG: sigma-70 family RNA polymerase sigma factor [Oscillospiraceae bacterium]|nr:sigma-70 family RNA polymerase sigma factor [Oscillospiraceae bacterium]
MEDSRIIDLYWARSEEALSETARKYGRYCHSIARNILNNDEDAEECVSDAYLRAWNAIPPARPARLQTWLGRIVRNLSLNKREKALAEKRGAGQLPLILDELAECIPDGPDGEALTESILIRDVLDRFLEALPPEARKIFVRRYWYLSSLGEIAEEYGISEGSAAVSLLRTRMKLKSVLEKEGIHL